MPYARAESAYLYYDLRGRGHPVLMIMGFGGTHHAWMAQVPAFRRHFRTITYDSRGLGRSRDLGEVYSIDTLAQDAIALLDHLGFERAHVVGYSLGGAVAQELAITYPQRVSKLVLAATLGSGQAHSVSPEVGRALSIGHNAGAELAQDGVLPVDIAQVMPAITGLAFSNPIA